MTENDPFEATQHDPGDSKKLSADVPASSCGDGQPERIGRYRIESVLGKGGFGLVYLAHDEQLHRLVAVKVPHPRLISQPEDAQAYLTEARTVANLDHPHIVPVYDVGSTDAVPCFIVSKYIEGTNLATRLKQSRLPHLEAAELVANVAEALHYAHKQGLVHRDVKPGNILMDRNGVPHVVDFGVALREENIGEGPRYAGTPAYMSPEQARGEGHRVDGRSDVYSLGAVLYRLLTGRQTCSGEKKAEILRKIACHEIKPPRQTDDTIPKELERICLKALSKRASQRYTTARDMADDLRDFVAECPPATGSVTGSDAETQPESDSTRVRSDTDRQPVRIVPKGLRSFDEHDAYFFLALLPGPRDREGLPDTLRFWKSRVEETDSDNTFSVGLIYGPSGCGKSSLVKAGLLPRLSDDVISVYVEATPAETESRLLHGLRKRCPDLAAYLDLKESLASLRFGEGRPVGKKVLIVLDHFEQWLHAKRHEDDADLVQALRQCDGGSVQTVVLVRDDFWMSATRFMQALEVPLLEGHNSAAVDLFSTKHARKVLRAFGHAYEQLPELPEEPDIEQAIFLQQAVDGLADEGKVICVRLAVFAEMMKSRPWTAEGLREVGGTEGVGVNFLEETFSAKSAPPSHRLHEQAVRAVLKALLPEPGSDIKGQMKSYADLLADSGYGERCADFDMLLGILDGQLRLITPTEPDESATDVDGPKASKAKYYQLTHDFLVPSLRQWLTRKQQETRRGRAELRLEELAALWNTRPENRLLPSASEYVRIRSLTRSENWSDPERKMMRRAGRVTGIRFVATLCLFVAATVASLVGWSQYRQTRAEALVGDLVRSQAEALPRAMAEVKPVANYAIPILRQHLQDENPENRLHAACALVQLGKTDFDFPVADLQSCSADECPNVFNAFELASGQWNSQLEEQIGAADQNPVFKARLAILALHQGNVTPAEEMLEFQDRPDPTERTVFIDTFANWHGDLSRLRRIVSSAGHPGLRSGICLALGKVEEIDAEAKADWQGLLTAWHQDQPDAGTHSATMWTLRQWDMAVPEINVAKNQAQQFDWIVTKETQLTMIRIPAGSLTPEDELSEFWLSDREISIALFKRFMAEAGPDQRPDDWPGAHTFEDTIDDDHPVQNVRWYDAVMFCNWLSVKEGREPYYDLSPNAGQYIVQPNGKADGFRLPTTKQWDYACLAGAATAFPFSFGKDVAFLADYCVYTQSSNQRSAKRGSRLCNAWGLFDMHGNVYEWCWDIKTRRAGQRSSSRVHRGGGWISAAERCEWSYLSGGPEKTYRDEAVGFRVAAAGPSSQSPMPAGRDKPDLDRRGQETDLD